MQFNIADKVARSKSEHDVNIRFPHLNVFIKKDWKTIEYIYRRRERRG